MGTKVYFGNPSCLDLLRPAGAETAEVMVVALSDMDQTLDVVDMAHRHFPNLRLVVRVRNRRHAHLLMERGVTLIVRETFHSSLVLTEKTLEALGTDPTIAGRAVGLFREHDEAELLKTASFFNDERQLIQNTQQSAAELASLFEADQAPPKQPQTRS